MANSTVRDFESASADLVAAYERLQSENEELDANIDSLEADVAALTDERDILKSRVAELEAELEEYKQQPTFELPTERKLTLGEL